MWLSCAQRGVVLSLRLGPQSCDRPEMRFCGTGPKRERIDLKQLYSASGGIPLAELPLGPGLES
jgi:hypothetical protein